MSQHHNDTKISTDYSTSAVDTKVNPFDRVFQLSQTTQEEKEKMRLLKVHVQTRIDNSEDFKSFLDDDCLRRFVQSRPVDTPLDKIRTLLDTALDYRQQEAPHQKTCHQCTENPLAHNCRNVGVDLYRRPVLYTCFSQAHDRWDVRGSFEHMMQVMETSTNVMNQLGVTRWVWIIDFNGFSIYDNNPKMALEFIKILKLFPGRLALALIVDPPWIFNKMWTMLKKAIDPTTAAKVQFCKHDGFRELEADEANTCWFGEELLNWLAVEMKENRADALLPSKSPYHKRYWEWYNVEHADPDQRTSLKAHDPRATASFLQSPEYALVKLTDDRHIQSLQLDEAAQEPGSEPAADDSDDSDMD
jgi:hypothetical protein